MERFAGFHIDLGLALTAINETLLEAKVRNVIEHKAEMPVVKGLSVRCCRSHYVKPGMKPALSVHPPSPRFSCLVVPGLARE